MSRRMGRLRYTCCGATEQVVKIAISGAHRTGKTTLIHELKRFLPNYVTIDEPYYLLEEEGHRFAEMPGLEDFELQLDRSMKSVVGSEGDCLFDRCPSDMLAYLFTHEDSDGFDIDLWLPRVRDAMQRLDLIVFVPVEKPDRVRVPASEGRALRSRVDDQLRDIILEDRWSFGVEAIEVTGPSHERAREVLARLGRADVRE